MIFISEFMLCLYKKSSYCLQINLIDKSHTLFIYHWLCQALFSYSKLEKFRMECSLYHPSITLNIFSPGLLCTVFAVLIYSLPPRTPTLGGTLFFTIFTDFFKGLRVLYGTNSTCWYPWLSILADFTDEQLLWKSPEFPIINSVLNWGSYFYCWYRSFCLRTLSKCCLNFEKRSNVLALVRIVWDPWFKVC